MEKFVVIKILDNYVLAIKDKEFIRAENKDFATRFRLEDAERLIKP